MKTRLRNYIESYPTSISWTTILIFLLTFQVNSYLIVYHFIPNPSIIEIKYITHGFISSAQIAFLYSLIFYSFLLIFFKIRILEPKKYLNNNIIVIIGILIISILFTLLLSQYIDSSSKKSPTPGYLIELFLGALFEEFVFRFFLLAGFIQLLKKYLGVKSIWISIIITSLIFSLGHLFDHIKHEYFSVKFYIWAFSTGVLLSWIYIWFNNILFNVFLHILLNLIILYLPLESKGVALGNFAWFLTTLLLVRFGYKIKRAIKENDKLKNEIKLLKENK